MNILKCENIRKYFFGRTGTVKALDGVSLEINKGEVFGLVGESGCGKTTLGKIILRILKPDSGQVALETEKIQVVFQDPHNSLDPRMNILNILGEGLFVKGQDNIRRRIEDILDLVKLPKTALNKYPHQFSGGERQRIAIGRAILTEPEFIVCDEPVSSLDMTTQLQILNLLKDIRSKFSIAYLFISHDLKAIRYICDRVAVMRQGKIVESGTVGDLYKSPSNPYTKALLTAAFYDTIKTDERDSL